MALFSKEGLDTESRMESFDIQKRKSAEYHRAYYKANKDRIADYQRAYREAHKDQIAEKMREKRKM